MTRKCIGCGKFLSTNTVHAAGSNYVSHVKEECLMVLFKKMKKANRAMKFISNDSLSEMMNEMFSLNRGD